LGLLVGELLGFVDFMRLWGLGIHSDANEDEREHAYELQKGDCRAHSLIV
jgi:hypothetical protein